MPKDHSGASSDVPTVFTKAPNLGVEIVTTSPIL